MNHKPIWFLGEMSEELCDKATKEFMLSPVKEAAMGEDGSVRNPHRNTSVRFISPNHWLTSDMRGFGERANKECKWNYEITGNENIQFAEYAIGQHYNWHVDNFPLGLQKFDRKVTVITLLSNPADYEGGDLFIRLYQDFKPELKKGSVIAFPSILEHKVTPVTKGVRYSATMWIYGPCFK
jgi:PKHD-type hydroxylase